MIKHVGLGTCRLISLKDQEVSQSAALDDRLRS
jgi:hypothetical protein